MKDFNDFMAAFTRLVFATHQGFEMELLVHKHALVGLFA